MGDPMQPGTVAYHHPRLRRQLVVAPKPAVCVCDTDTEIGPCPANCPTLEQEQTMPELDNPDDYPEDDYDYDAWLAVPPPAELGPAIRAIVATAVGLDAAARADMEAAFDAAYNDAMDDAEQRCNEALDGHPIGEGASCQEITTAEPWINAIRMKVGYGACYVARAVAARDHDLISADDFAALTGWWVEAGLPIPAPIADDHRQTLIQWWTELGVRVPNQGSQL